MKYIASVSFGKDSLAMLLRLIEDKYPLDTVVFYNTGMEFNAIYEIRDKMKLILRDKGIEFVELHPDESFLYCMLEKKIKHRDKPGYHYGFEWCGGRCRWGTYYKMKSIKRYKKEVGDEIIDYVGIAADEHSRFDKQKAEGKKMPLVEWGMTESDCLSYCHERGWFWYEDSESQIELYDILDRVSCWCCANKNLKELRNIYNHLPGYWNKLEKLQSQIVRPFRGFYKNKPVGIFELAKRFESEVVPSD